MSKTVPIICHGLTEFEELGGQILCALKLDPQFANSKLYARSEVAEGSLARIHCDWYPHALGSGMFSENLKRFGYSGPP